jgi:hypothetical protein
VIDWKRNLELRSIESLVLGQFEGDEGDIV